MSWMMWCVMLSLLQPALDYGLHWIMMSYYYTQWAMIVAKRYTQMYITLMTIYLVFFATGEANSYNKQLNMLIDWHVLDQDIVFTWLSCLEGFGPDPITAWWDMLNDGLNGPILWDDSWSNASSPESSDADSYSNDDDDSEVDWLLTDLPVLVVD